MSADHVNAAEQHDRGLAVAWPSRAICRSAIGSICARSPDRDIRSRRRRPKRWRRGSSAVRVAPDRPEGWHALGESFYYDGEMVGMRDGPARAADGVPSRAAARSVVRAVASHADAVARAASRHRGAPTCSLSANGVDTADSMSVFIRWRAAHALRRLARAEASAACVRRCAERGASQHRHDEPVRRRVDRRRRSCAGRFCAAAVERRGERSIWRWRTTAGRSTAAIRAAFAITREWGARQPALHPQLAAARAGWAVLECAIERAAAAAAELERHGVAAGPRPRADSAVRLADVCVVGQWRLAMHDTTGAREAVRALRAGRRCAVPGSRRRESDGLRRAIDVSLAVAERGPAARDRLAHLDSLMLSGPAVSDAMRYANLIVARHYQAIGDPAHALAALQRRSYMRGWPRYRATGLQLQIAARAARWRTATRSVGRISV